MKLRSILFAGLLLLCLPAQIFGQKTNLSKTYLVKTYDFYKNPDPSLHHLNYFDAMAEKMKLSPQSKMVLTEESNDRNGQQHFKYQQFQDGVPIFGSRYVLHEKEGHVITATGHYTPLATERAQPGLNPETALAFAQKAMHARAYDEKRVEPLLCFIDPAFPEISENLSLAYQIDLCSTEPFDKQRYFVDASTGTILCKFPLIHQQGVPSTAKTRYYGVQNIITDSISPQSFVLRDPSRGNGIFIFNNDESIFTNTSSTWDLTNAAKDEVATDAHYCTQEYYDMMLEDYNWQGQDGNGGALKVHVHIGDFANAFWDGESTSFADGDCTYGPLTTLEVVGHEFTHGMVDYTSKLVYDKESGAMNESLADMFGKMLEKRTDPANFSWDLGHSFLLTPDAAPFRVMDDPNVLQMPALYNGLYWDDNNDVHTNSSIGNLWFSLLVDGKQGINELGINYDVTGLGMIKAGQIVFDVNKNYLIENSNYNDFYQYSIAAAESLFGAGSTEVMAVEEAWKAVGLPNAPAGAFDLNLVGPGFATNNFCGIGEFLPVSFKIVNASSVAYDPAMMGVLTLTTDVLQPYVIPLTNPIGPGEVFEIHVNDWLKATVPGYLYVNADLDLLDENQDNNSSYSIFSVTAHEADDLNIFVNLNDINCFDTEQSIGVFVTNNSCATIAAGTSFSITASDNSGNPFWSAPPYLITNDFPGFSTIYIPYILPVSSSALTFKLIYPNDPEPNNNEYEDVFFQTNNTITGNYLNDFETNSGMDGYLQLTGLQQLTMFYQNSNYFASSGYYQDPEAFERCADPLAVFKLDYASGINATIHTCVDFSFSDAPSLEFDLAQFRNAYAEASNFENSSMFQAKWTGSDKGDQIIFGQPESLVKHHNISLPPYFKGALDFKLYTEIGQWGLDPNLLGADDFELLDNLKLSAPTSGTQDLNIGNLIQMAPNPAKESTLIQSNNPIQTIQLQHINGQTIQSIQVNASSLELDLKGIQTGFYLLNIQLENGQMVLKKLVKMD